MLNRRTMIYEDIVTSDRCIIERREYRIVWVRNLRTNILMAWSPTCARDDLFATGQYQINSNH
jgi:hypothetical protein